MKDEVINSLAEAIADCYGLNRDEIARLIERPKNTEHGDLALPCFLLAKQKRQSPQVCAQAIAADIKLPPLIAEAVPLGPFLNFRIKPGPYVASVLARAELKPKELKPRKVLIEYSSPNIAKPFHVGHLRATLIGSSLVRIYRFLGHNVISINHLGDWGTQFGFVWAGLKLWGEPAEDSVQALVELYKKATALKAEQEQSTNSGQGLNPAEPNVNEMARQFFLDLEEGKDYAIAFWQRCLKVSEAYLKATYQRLDVDFDHYTGESFYSDKLEAVRLELEEAGLLKESQGAYGVDLGEKLGFARISTPDGRSLYLTRDLATAKYRAETFNFDQALYVVGAPQSLHFEQIKGVLKALGRDYADKIEHVAFGHVMGMKTRGAANGSQTIELNDFLDEAYDRALRSYHEQVSKRPQGLDDKQVAEAVARAAIVFSTLFRDRLKDVHFSWEHALEFQGDTGPYLLYALARINSMLERAEQAGILARCENVAETLVEKSAYELACAIEQLPLALEQSAKENDPAHLASYALELAKAFSRAYNELKVLGEDISKELSGSRLYLFLRCKEVLSTTITLLGMKTIDRM